MPPHVEERSNVFSWKKKIYDLKWLFPLGEFHPLNLGTTTEMRTSKLSNLTYLQTRGTGRELTQAKNTSVITQPLRPPAALNIVEFAQMDSFNNLSRGHSLVLNVLP